MNFMNLTRRAKNVLALFALVAAGGCIHQDPDGEGIDPTLVHVTMEVAFDCIYWQPTQFWYHRCIELQGRQNPPSEEVLPPA